MPSTKPIAYAALLLILVFSTASASLSVGQTNTAVVENRSPRYLSASLDSNTHATAAIYPKIVGQPQNGVGYGDAIAAGEYSVALRFKISAPLQRFNLKIETDGGDNWIVNLLESGRTYFPEVWYEVSLPLSVDPIADERWRFILLASVVPGAGVVTVDLDDIRITRAGGDTLLQGNLSFDEAPFATGSRPPTSLITAARKFERFEIRDNIRWQRLSDWYETNRVQQHSRYSPTDYTIPYSEYLTKSDDPDDFDPKHQHWYWHGAEHAASIGARVWTRHVKSRLEGPHWLTRYPARSDIAPEDLVWQALLNNAPEDRNPIDDFLQLSNDNNLHTIAYYRMIGDTPLAQFTPYDGWLALKPNGQPVPVSTDPDNPFAVPGYRMSMFSPYPMDVVRWRMLELAEKGFAGAYFDASHGVTKGDWSSWAAQTLLERYDTALPSERNLGLPAYRQLLSGHTDRLVEVFEEIQRFVRERFPDFQFIVSTFNYADLVSLNSSVDLVSRLQIPKTERKLGSRLFNQFFDREVTGRVPVTDYPNDNLANEFGVTLVRDTANGRPPHVWIHNPAELERFDENGDDLLAWELGISTHQLLAASSSVLAMGAVANVDVYDDFDFGLLPMPATHLEPVFSMGAAAQEFLSYSRPLRTVCVHVNEQARDNLFDDFMDETNVADVLEQHWRIHMAPVIFAFDTVRRAGVPVGFVTDPQLSAHELGTCRALVLPSSDLSPAQSAAVATFSAAGGVVAMIDHRDWSRANQRATAEADLLDTLQQVIDESTVSVDYAYSDGETSGFFVRHDDEQGDSIIVALSGELTWLRDPSTTPAEKSAYVPRAISPASVSLRGISAADIESMHALRFASHFQSWVTTRIPKRNLQKNSQGVTVRLDDDTVGASRHLRLLRIKLNRRIL